MRTEGLSRLREARVKGLHFNLMALNRKIGLAWAKEHRTWCVEDLCKVLWTELKSMVPQGGVMHAIGILRIKNFSACKRK